MSIIKRSQALFSQDDKVLFFRQPDFTVGEMTNFVFYIASFDEEDIDSDKVFPLFIENIIREKDEAFLICVEKMTYGSFIKKEINIWFPKSAIEEGGDLHINSRISEIYIKGWFLIRLVKGQYEYEL